MNGPTKKVKARDEFVSFTEKTLHTKLSLLNKKQQSLALTQFYLREIHNKLRPEISDEDIDLGLVDGPGDIGIDFIHKDDGHVTIVQAKYRGAGAKEPHEEVSYFQSVLKRLADSSIKISERLQNQISDIDLHNDSFSLVYLTFGEIANQAKTISREEPSYPNGFPDLDERCDWEFLDETGLNEEIRTALSSDSDAANRTISLYPSGH